jgi:hypothetical protein
MKKAIYPLWLYCLLSCFYFNTQAQSCAGNCLNLSNGGHVDVVATAAFNGANALTIEAWVYPTSFATVGNCGTIICKTSTGGAPTAANTTFWLRLEQASLVAYISNGTTLCPVAASNTLVLNKWNHVAVVWQLTQHRLCI